MKTSNIKKISIIALFSAVGAVLMFFDIPLPIAPSFLKMDISELPVMIGGFLLGPLSCVTIAILKVLIKLSLKSTSTVFIGELANVIASVSYALPASLIYSRFKSRQRAALGIFLGTCIASLIITILNYIVLFPAYINIYGMSEQSIIDACKAINPFIDNMLKVMLLSVLPFNIIKFTITSIFTLVLYKNISRIIKSIV